MKKLIDVKAWGHRELIEDLAGNFMGERIVFAEATIGSRWLSGGEVGAPDLLTFEKSYTRPTPTVYEVKVSKSDFLADVRKEKWTRYLPYCRRFYFACPRGMLAKADLPEGTGLITRGEDGWAVAAAPRITAGDGLTRMDAQALLMAGCFTLDRVRRLRERVVLEDNAKLGDRCKKLGWQISESISRLRDGDSAAAGAHVMKSVAKVLGIAVEELVALTEYDVESRLMAREKFVEAARAMGEIAGQIECGEIDIAKAFKRANDHMKLLGKRWRL